MNKKMKMVEVSFNILYLFAAMGMGLYLLASDTFIPQMWGVMSIVLASGDAFHLVPRIVTALKGSSQSREKFAGIGKMITSITMAIFYLILWHIGLKVFSLSLPIFSTIIYILVLARIILCAMPHNNWLGSSPHRWTVLRNIPFLMQGLATMLLYLTNINKVPAVNFVWLAITISFAFYLPVIFWGHKNKKLGALMLPKSVAYLWIVAIGFLL